MLPSASRGRCRDSLTTIHTSWAPGSRRPGAQDVRAILRVPTLTTPLHDCTKALTIRFASDFPEITLEATVKVRWAPGVPIHAACGPARIRPRAGIVGRHREVPVHTECQEECPPMETAQPSSERGRPRLHFTAQQGWINDPHTLVHHGGLYHLFFQYVPGSTEWKPSCHWGHATSADLLAWRELDPVLTPDGDEDGCWSGSMAGPPARIFYTSVTEENRELGAIRVALPRDDTWDTWVKDRVVLVPPDEPRLDFFRDPFLQREGDGWRMLVGAALSDGTAAVLGYRSDDLETWSPDGMLDSRPSTETSGTWTGTGWECPALLRVDGRDVLLVSVWDDRGGQFEAYCVGSLVEGRLVGGTWRRLTHGSPYYAGAAFTDAAGRPGLIHWLRGIVDTEAGWAGAHSLPQLVRVDGDRLVARPHDALTARRRDPAQTVTAGSAASGSTTLHLPADLEWTPGPSGGRLEAIGLGLAITASAAELTFSIGAETSVLGWEPGETIRVVADGPVAEAFTRDGVVAGRLSTARQDSAEIRMTGAGSLRTWRVPAADGDDVGLRS